LKPDDSSLAIADLIAIEKRASDLLDRADAWDRFPIPIDDILAAANVKVARHSIFDPASIIAYLVRLRQPQPTSSQLSRKSSASMMQETTSSM
jgi:hypothetical protein